MMVDASITSRSYTNLSLSFRGSERQAPSILSLALTFSKVMQDKASTGQHDGNLGTDARLKGIITEFNESPGVLSKWKIDSGKERAILNLLIGTSKGTRALIQSHLDYHKWAYCCFTSELLRSNRWLIGASRRGVKDYLKSVLTVSEVSQENFMTNMISNFAFQTRKTKPSSRSKLRASQQEWDQMVDYTCVMCKVMEEAEEMLESDPEKQNKVLESLSAAFMNRPGYLRNVLIALE